MSLTLALALFFLKNIPVKGGPERKPMKTTLPLLATIGSSNSSKVELGDVGAGCPAKATVIALESSVAADNGDGSKMSPPAAAIKITPSCAIARVSQRRTVFEVISLPPPLYGWQSHDCRIF
jgi:hypothetical protein